MHQAECVELLTEELECETLDARERGAKDPGVAHMWIPSSRVRMSATSCPGRRQLMIRTIHRMTYAAHRDGCR